MKKNCKRLLALIIVLMTLMLCFPASAFADSTRVFSVYAYTYATESAGWLTMIEHNGEAYIYPDDLNTICGNGKLKTDEKGNFTFDSGNFGMSGSIDTCQGIFEGISYTYVNLKEICDLIKMQYYYSEENETLYFIPCSAYAENLYQDCEAVFNDYYDLQYIENEFGVGLAAAYNIIGGMRFDALWGGYAKEQYESAISGILNHELSEDDTLEFVSTFDKTMGKLVKLRKFEHTDFDGTTHPYVYVDNDYAGFVDAYGEMSGLVEGLQIGDFLEIAQRVYASKHALEMYVNAVKYGIIESDVSDNTLLVDAAHIVYDYYDENTPDIFAVIVNEVDNYVGNVSADAIKDAVIKEIMPSLNKTYLYIAKFAMDSLGMKNITTAVEQMLACSEIQECARDTYYCSYEQDKNGFITGESAVKMKYCTILYLRACQYAYEKYEFDQDMKWVVDFWKNKTDTAIKQLTAYDDEVLTEPVRNKWLNLFQNGFYFYETEPEPTPAPTQQPTSAPAPQPAATPQPVATPQPTKAPQPAATPKPAVTAKPQKTPAAPYGSGYMIADGEYTVSVSKSMVSKESYGWHFYADTEVPDTYTNEVVSALKKGDKLDGVKINSMKQSKGTIYINGDEFILRKNTKDGLWHSYWSSDAPKTHFKSRQEFRIFKKSTKMYDNFTYTMFGQGKENAKISDFMDYFSSAAFKNGMFSADRAIDLKITVENGVPTKVVWEYRA